MNPLKRLHEAAYGLPSAENQALMDIVDILVDLLTADDLTSNDRKKFLSELQKYLNKKKSKSIATNRDELDYLRYVRNALVHRNSLPEEAIRVAIPMFWRVLPEVATDWDWSRLSNLLSYGLGQKAPLALSTTTPLKTRLRKYEDRFKGLHEVERDIAFRNLLLSIFSAPEFQAALKKSRLRRSTEKNND